MPYQFTKEDRLKGQQANKTRTGRIQIEKIKLLYGLASEEEWAVLIIQHLTLMAAGVMKAHPMVIGAARTVLPYVAARLKAVDQQEDSQEPINIAKVMEDAVKLEHGNVWGEPNAKGNDSEGSGEGDGEAAGGIDERGS